MAFYRKNVRLGHPDCQGRQLEVLLENNNTTFMICNIILQHSFRTSDYQPCSNEEYWYYMIHINQQIKLTIMHSTFPRMTVRWLE